MKNAILFPCNPFNYKEVDPDFKSEFNICNQIDINYILFDFDLFIKDIKDKKIGKYKLNKKPNGKIWMTCVYRGWMLKVSHYKEMYDILNSNGIQLINTPGQYKMAHYFPKAYPSIKTNTPLTKWIDKKVIKEEDDKFVKGIIESKISIFKNKFMLKDFAKSFKLKNNEVKAYSKNDNIDYIYSEVLKFVEQRETFGNFYGGIVFKEFVQLKHYSNLTNEWRLFILDGKIISHDQNSNLIDATIPIIENFESIAKKLPVVFYTMDIAELVDGSWTIIEVGDAQVSGLAPNQKPIGLFNNLKMKL